MPQVIDGLWSCLAKDGDNGVEDGDGGDHDAEEGFVCVFHTVVFM
jgi:hypothetical protein